MIVKKTTFPAVLSHFFVICLISSITIFTTYTWGRYVLMGGLAAILLCGIARGRGKYRFRIEIYFVLILVFIAYTAVSGLWAINASRAIEKTKTLLEILLMVFVLYNHYRQHDDGVKMALQDIKLSSFVIVIYTLLFYGVAQLMLMAMAEDRLDGEFANVNTIGILAALGTIIQLDEWIGKKKFSLWVLFCVPSLFLIAVTQSRKALVMVGMGLALILWFRNINSGNFFKTLFRLILYVGIGVAVVSFILSLPVFSGIMLRMETLLNSFTGEGKVDSSTLVRQEMVEIGIQTFLKYPFFGVGIGNSNELVKLYLHHDAYLHNNFIELLASGGIVGFLIYYSMYIYLIVQFWKYRKQKNDQYVICLTLMLVLLAMDYGRVSYYAKTQYIFLMTMFLQTNTFQKIKKRHLRLKGVTQ